MTSENEWIDDAIAISGQNPHPERKTGGLCARLSKGCIWMTDNSTNCVVDPERTDDLLFEASSTIRAQAAELERLRGALETIKAAAPSPLRTEYPKSFKGGFDTACDWASRVAARALNTEGTSNDG